MQYTPLGGVLYYDVFYLPPQAHQVDGWKIRQVRKHEKCWPGYARLSRSNMPLSDLLFAQLLDHGLKGFPYPPQRCDSDGEEQVTSPPVGVSVTLPDSVIFLETPHVARWDDAGRSLNAPEEPESVQTVKMSDIERVLPSSEAVEAG